MTTITIDRAVVEQALDALKDDQYRMVATSEGHWEFKTDLAIAALERALAQPNTAQQVVDEQAEDEGLWFRAQTAAEAYLQQELRRLHAAVEGEK